MELLRKPTPKELSLLELLVRRAPSLQLPPNWKDDILVETMNDGGMGSLLLFPNGFTSEKRAFGGQVSDYEFFDADDVKVSVALNVDKSGELFEMDSWKVNFDPLIRFPDDL
jgi:hypothetical protein